MLWCLEIKIWQTGNGLESLPSICMTSKYSGHFRIINSRMMRSIGVWASLAFLVIVVAAQNCDQPCSCSCDAATPGPEIITYGEPCFCKRSFPYAIQVFGHKTFFIFNCLANFYFQKSGESGEPIIYCTVFTQVPVSKSEVVESRKSYGYSVERPAPASCVSSLQLPIQIQKPVVQQEQIIDRLRGRSYGVTVQHQRQQQPCVPNYSFDVAVQRPVVPVANKPVFET